jgi:hypothetical protein
VQTFSSPGHFHLGSQVTDLEGFSEILNFSPQMPFHAAPSLQLKMPCFVSSFSPFTVAPSCRLNTKVA